MSLLALPTCKREGSPPSLAGPPPCSPPQCTQNHTYIKGQRSPYYPGVPPIAHPALTLPHSLSTLDAPGGPRTGPQVRKAA